MQNLWYHYDNFQFRCFRLSRLALKRDAYITLFIFSVNNFLKFNFEGCHSKPLQPCLFNLVEVRRAFYADGFLCQCFFWISSNVTSGWKPLPIRPKALLPGWRFSAFPVEVGRIIESWARRSTVIFKKLSYLICSLINAAKQTNNQHQSTISNNQASF